MSLSLSKKAIILVAVPLAFEIVFVISLAVLLQQVGIEREKENRARELTTHVNAGLIALMDRFSSCILYHVSDSPIFRRRFDLARDRIKSEINYMRGVVVDSPEDRKRLETIEDMLIGSGESLQRAQGQLEQGDKIAAARQWVLADRAIGKLLKAIDEISQSTQLALDQRKAAQEAYVRMVEQLLVAGVLFNILLAVALALSFNRGTSNRLKVLVDNTLRLAADKPLSAPLSGSDEIAKLDGTFREMAQALEESRIKERAVVDNAADVICSVDRSGILEVNPAASRLWGYSREELIGKSLSDFVVESERRATEDAMAALMSGGEQTLSENRIFENRIVTKSGAAVDFAWSAHWSAKEKALFLVGRDISERKQIDRMKRDFVAMVSHDLRTPLTSIQMVLSLLEAEAYGALSDAGHENLEAAEANVARLIALVNGLLDLEKMESGKLELSRDTFKLSELIEPAISSVKGFAEQQKVKIECTGLPAVSVFADRDRMVQVLVNVISNAIKFSPKPGIVTVEAEERTGAAAVGARVEGGDKNKAGDNADAAVIDTGGAGFVKVLVRDQGRGVPEEMRESIFEHFKQVEAGDQKIHGGSGLGLAICKAIVERHGGKIGVEPGESGGSIFWFTLPKV